MSTMFFYFLKIIFNINTLKRSKKYKPHLILIKKKSKFSEKQLKLKDKHSEYTVTVWLHQVQINAKTSTVVVYIISRDDNV